MCASSATTTWPCASPRLLELVRSARTTADPLPSPAPPSCSHPRSVFLPAADIPRFVGEGNVDFGITGQDMVAEADVNGLVSEVLALEFGKCKLQVQVPLAGDIKTVDDLVGRKVVTSFEVLAGQYFGELDRKSGKGVQTKIEYVGGSVEAACALGLADGIGAFSFLFTVPALDLQLTLPLAHPQLTSSVRLSDLPPRPSSRSAS